MDKPLSDRNVYYNLYTPKELPLDADYDGRMKFTGPLYKHGCTNDLKELWRKTAENLAPFEQDDAKLHRELVSLNLISRSLNSNADSKRNMKKGKAAKRKTPRKQRAVGVGAGSNPHLRGTKLERVMQETYEKSLRLEEQQRDGC
jgi:hypothetical protein